MTRPPAKPTGGRLAAQPEGPMLPPGSYDGRVALVTGGGTGLGKAIAVEFGRLGATVVIASRSDEHRAKGIAAVEAVGGNAVSISLDVSDADAVSHAFDEIESATGSVVSVLINNAAANFPVLATNLSPNGWRAVERIVLDGTFFCSQHLHRRAVSAGKQAAIVNIVTTAALSGGPGMVHSASAKAGVISMTKTLAVEWARDGVRVNAIAPGLFPHEDLPAAIQAARDPSVDDSRQPAGRTGEPRELGWAATYLCSPFANFITGHVLVVDGGNWLRRDFAMPPFRPVDEQIPSRKQD